MDSTVGRKLGVLMFSTGVLGSGSLFVVGLQPALLVAGYSPAEGAALVTAFSLSFALSAPLSQILIGHWRRRSAIITGLALLALGCVLSALLTDFYGVVAARLLSGVGAGICSPMSSALAANLVPERLRGYALARIFSGVTIASVFAAPTAIVVAKLGGWRLAMLGMGGMALLAALMVMLFIPDADRGSRMRLKALMEILRHRPSRWALLGNVAQVSAIFTSLTLIGPLMMGCWHCDQDAVTAILLGFGIIGLLGNYWVRRLALRHSSVRVTDVASLAFMLAFTLLGEATAFWPTGALALLIWSLAQDIYYPSQQRTMADLQPDCMGLVLALNSCGLFLGMSAGSALSGQMVRIWGLWAVPWCSVVLIGIALACRVLSRRRA